MALRFVFRDLPGIAELTKIYSGSRWAPEWDEFAARLDRTSKALFGITRDYTHEFIHVEEDDGEDATEEEVDAYELHFKVLDCPFQQQVLIWEMIGWDVTDGFGQPHPLLDRFDRQIIAATKGLHGHLPGETPQDPELIAEQAAGWGSSLEAQARAFLQKRGRAR